MNSLGITQEIQSARDQRLRQIPSQMKEVYKKSFTSKSLAVKAFCQECMGWNKDGITNCTAYACPLWPHRPYVKRAKGTRKGNPAALRHAQKARQQQFTAQNGARNDE